MTPVTDSVHENEVLPDNWHIYIYIYTYNNGIGAKRNFL
jgi:hypothetical protein